MTSLPPPSPTRSPSAPSHINPVDSPDRLGPVTKLAALAAARHEEDRARQRRAALDAAASIVGETALVIAAANASGSSIRLSPAQRRGVTGGATSGTTPTSAQRSAGAKMSPVGGSGGATKMSVAARARAAADQPIRQRTPPRMPAVDVRGSGDNGGRGGVRPAPASGGVMRGRFSKDQVEQMLDQWGRDDTSDDDDDDDEYYYEGEGASDSSDPDVVDHHQYKQSLERAHHHLTYTMSNSPGPKEDEEFHYQHHRVSAYSTAATDPYRRGGSHTPPRRDQHRRSHGDEKEEGGGLFASARSWIQSQREKLHQIELERQVEDQRRKLVAEGRRQRAIEAERRRSLAAAKEKENAADELVDRGTANKNNHAGEPLPQSGDDQPVVAPSSSFCGDFVNDIPGAFDAPGQSVVSAHLCGFGGAYANEFDDSTDYDGVERVDSDGNILDLVPSGSMDSPDCNMKVCMKVSSPKCSASGQGMSVKVDLPIYKEQNDEGAGMDENGDSDNGAERHNNKQNEDEEDDEPVIHLVPEPTDDGEDGSPAPQILEVSHMKALISSGGLPPSLNFCKWKRVYSLARDGDSFEQFLRLVEGHDRTVLVVRSANEEMFGGYADTRWEAKHSRQHANQFYGSAQACLFRFPNVGTGEGKEDEIRVYKWTGANRYIQLCDLARRTVAFGGGGHGGVFGLCIEDDFRRGTTGHCSTFENEPLCEEGYFDVVDLEVWGFALDYF